MKIGDIFRKSCLGSPIPPSGHKEVDHIGKLQQPSLDSWGKDQSYKKCHFHELWKFEDTHFWFRYRNDLIAWALAHFWGTFENFLEIGCGNGYVSGHLEKLFPSSNFVGIDLFSEGLSFAKRRSQRMLLARMDFRHPGFKSMFEVVGLLDVLEHISDDRAALESLHDIMKPSGCVIITVPQYQWMWSESDRIACHKRRYSRRGLSNKLSEAGFTIVYITSFISLLLPVLFFSRQLHKLSAGKSNLNELNISPLVNRVSGMICNLEGMILRKGFSAPCGGSLLAVAVKSS